MRNILIVLIIAILIWLVGSKMGFSHRSTNSSIIKPETVQKIQDDSHKHLEEARKLEKQVKERLRNN